jgi:hypothetical protein
VSTNYITKLKNYTTLLLLYNTTQTVAQAAIAASAKSVSTHYTTLLHYITLLNNTTQTVAQAAIAASAKSVSTHYTTLHYTTQTVAQAAIAASAKFVSTTLQHE